MLSIIVCSISDAKLSVLRENIRKTIGAGVRYELLSVDNRHNPRSLAEVYNSLAEKAVYDNLLFIHEDVTFVTEGWYSRIAPRLAAPDTGLIGFAGAAVMADAPSGWAQSHKFMVANLEEKGEETRYNTATGEDFTPVVAIDGLAMFMRKDIWRKFPFDSSLLTGFHCYDIDESLTVGTYYRNYVCNCVDVRHDSKGHFGKEWVLTTLKCYAEKWHKLLPRASKEGIVTLSELEEERERQYYRIIKTMRREGIENESVMRRFREMPFSLRHLGHRIKLFLKR